MHAAVKISMQQGGVDIYCCLVKYDKAYSQVFFKNMVANLSTKTLSRNRNWDRIGNLKNTRYSNKIGLRMKLSRHIPDLTHPDPTFCQIGHVLL